MMRRAELDVADLGRMTYARAYERQCVEVEKTIARRGSGGAQCGVLLLVEHPPVITVSRRPTAVGNLLASAEALGDRGVEVVETDRGGDITYHGPGQLVGYAILDLNMLGLGLHEYMRMLESAVIGTLAALGVEGRRDAAGTGVWVSSIKGGGDAKVCALGVRVRRWVSMHGLAINVTTDLTHFDLIVPCGLVGRGVTSLLREMGDACPSMEQVKDALVDALGSEVERAAAKARAVRESGA